jgi:aminoglycoside/choline kinase family phosphotransferase
MPNSTIEHYLKQAFNKVPLSCSSLQLESMKGGGSSRLMTRVFPDGPSGATFVLVENSEPQTFGKGIDENESFQRIGSWLKGAGGFGPEMIDFDLAGKRYILEDLGDTHLLDFVRNARHTPDSDSTIQLAYQEILQDQLTMQAFMRDHFQQDRVHSLPYDFELMRIWESGYFQERFLHGLLGIPAGDDALAGEFDRLATRAANLDANWFVYRDLQSTNVMRNADRWRYIDFQGGRSGPLHYDVASLLYDPYVALPLAQRRDLLQFFATEAESRLGIDGTAFLGDFPLIAVHRMMQALGAFGLLSKVKKKLWFLDHIPVALLHLQELLREDALKDFPHLAAIVDEVVGRLDQGLLDQLREELGA